MIGRRSVGATFEKGVTSKLTNKCLPRSWVKFEGRVKVQRSDLVFGAQVRLLAGRRDGAEPLALSGGNGGVHAQGRIKLECALDVYDLLIGRR